MNTRIIPSLLQLLVKPGGGLIGVANQAGVGTVLLPESFGHSGIRYVVKAMGSGLRYKGVHDSRHMTGEALARFRVRRMACMLPEQVRIAETLMTLNAHLVRLIAESQ